jgi:putative pyruvate formate lyase activating enzyme
MPLPISYVDCGAEFDMLIHPDNFCDPASHKYREKYADIARRPTHAELHASWQRAYELGLKFEITTFERGNALGVPAQFGK